MKAVQEAIANVWDALNPSEPSPRYLATFMGVAAVLFAFAILIGH